MDFDLQLDKTAEKGCILNSRILWFFASAALATGREDLRAEADHAYRFMTQHCVDRTNGGVYWSVTYDASRWTPPSTPTIRRLPSMRCPPTIG